jgi:ADP-L-glycero-D-manno-heptose 6-epimerase
MIIITGGAGFIGSAICWRLNKMGIEDIIIVDSDLEGTKKKNLENLKYTDYIDKETFLLKIMKNMFHVKHKTVYHMGACTSTTEEDMEYLKRNNFEYSVHLAEWALKNDVRFIYASSAATYGDGSLGFDDDVNLIPELKPLNKYGLSKQMFDLWVLEKKLENKVVGLKYFNVFGPNENHKGDMRSMVNKAYSEIMNTGKLKLFKSYKPEYADGEQKRDFLYIKDAVEMTVFFDDVNPQGKNCFGIYNAGSGNACTWNRLAGAIFKALGKPPDIIYVDMPKNIINQYQYYTEANMTKLRNAGYTKPVMSIEDSVKDYVVNYLSKDKYLNINDA